MMDGEFSLLHEPWIVVLDKHGSSREAPLLGVLREAHEYRSLAGELPTQDVALLRFLLAVIYSVFTRYDPDGNFAPLDNEPDALGRWAEIWERGHFPMPPLEKYLDNFSERFFLFHPETPFYQVAGLERGTKYTASKLMGDLSESGNKVRLFAMRTGDAKKSLAYAEAARWLIYLNAFDDTSSKPSVRGGTLSSPGAGWLGKLGLVYVAGQNLFETLMLNFALTKEGYKPGGAIWEKGVKKEERTQIPFPETRAELLSLQSRRIELLRQDGGVIGYKLLGGDFFEKENAFIEYMTMWHKDRDKHKESFSPKRHNPAKAFWRDFSALAAKRADAVRPGVVDWVEKLKSENLLQKRVVTFQTASVKYGDKDFFVDDVFSDSIVVNAALLTQLGEEWLPRIEDAVKKTEESVNRFGDFARNLGICAGGEGDADSAKERAYHALDGPFRAWLAGIDPAGDMDEKVGEWFAQTHETVYALAYGLLAEAGETALVGRYVKGDGGKETLFTAPVVHAWFTSAVRKILGGRQ
jgi:CRISPR system Cascade subunit CasA